MLKVRVTYQKVISYVVPSPILVGYKYADTSPSAWNRISNFMNDVVVRLGTC
jgi:hypothetical protein